MANNKSQTQVKGTKKVHSLSVQSGSAEASPKTVIKAER